jgi:hypothetical protein
VVRKEGNIGMKIALGVLQSARVVKFLMFNVFAGAVLWWLILDDPRRMPILFLFVPCIVLTDVILIRRFFAGKLGTSFSLPVIYLLGFAYGVWWVIQNFAWWKVPLLLVPLLMLLFSLRALSSLRRLARRGGLTSEK